MSLLVEGEHSPHSAGSQLWAFNPASGVPQGT